MNVSTKRSESDFGNGSDAVLRRENERLKADIERLRERLDAQNADFSELKSHFARYETALRGSKVTVFTQDRDHAGSMDGFLSQFSGRLHSLAAAHDLLVRDSWRGASMRELIQAQLAAYIDDEGQRVSMSGPAIALKPEAGQTLGPPRHELG